MLCLFMEVYRMKKLSKLNKIEALYINRQINGYIFTRISLRLESRFCICKENRLLLIRILGTNLIIVKKDVIGFVKSIKDELMF